MRIHLILPLGLSLVTSVGAFFLVRVRLKEDRAQVLERARVAVGVQAGLLQETLASLLAQGQRAQAERHLAMAAMDPHARILAVVDPGGRVLLAQPGDPRGRLASELPGYDPLRALDCLHRGRGELYDVDGTALRGHFPLLRREGGTPKVLGVLYVDQDLALPLAQERHLALRQGGLALAMGWGMALLVALVLYRKVRWRARALEGAMVRLAGGDFGLQVQSRGPGDFGELERAFARMVEQLALQRMILARSEQRFRTSFEYAPIALWEEDGSVTLTAIRQLWDEGVRDLRGYLVAHPGEVVRLISLVRILEVNQRALDLFGVPSKEVLVQYLSAFFTEGSLEVFREELLALAAGAQYFEREVPMRDFHGVEHTLSLCLRVLPGHEVELTRALVALQDVTNRTRADVEQLAQDLRLARTERLEGLEDLAEGVAQDLEELLGVVRQEAQDLGATAILQACDRGQDIARGLQAFARPTLQDSGPVDLHFLLADLSAALAPELERVLELDPDLPALLGDVDALSQVFGALLQNAREAIPQEGRLTLRVLKLPEGGLEVHVEDTGVGMDAEVLPRAVEPYFSTKPGRRGLGLAVARGIVQAHEGTLELHSQPGWGTQVVLRFPAYRSLVRTQYNPSPSSPEM